MRTAVTSDRTRLLTGPMVTLLAVTFGALTNFFALMSVVPLYAATGGAGEFGAGAVTGVMMLSTVLIEPVAPRLATRYGYRAAMICGLVLLGVPAAALALSPALPLVLAVSLARGAGLGIVVVLGPALVAEYVPAARRGEGLGLYGIAGGVPATVGLPLGVWLADRIGFAPLFLVAAGLAVTAIAGVFGLPSARTRGHRPAGARGWVRGGGLTPLARLAIVFAAFTLAAGVFMTFLPLAVGADGRHVAAVALLVMAGVAPVMRWLAGRFGDRHGAGRLLVPSVLLATAGTACVVLVDSPVAVIIGMVLFGTGYGAAQNVTLALMFERAPEAELGRASALWNVAYDGGMGIGAVGFGLIAGPVGYPVAFALLAAVLLAAVLPASRDRAINR